MGAKDDGDDEGDRIATTRTTSATVAGSAGPVVKGLGRSRSNYSR